MFWNYIRGGCSIEVRALRGERVRQRQREVTTSRIVFQCFWPMISPWKQVFFFFFSQKKKKEKKPCRCPPALLLLFSVKSGKAKKWMAYFTCFSLTLFALSFSPSLSLRLSHFFFFLSFSLVFLVSDFCEKAWFWPLWKDVKRERRSSVKSSADESGFLTTSMSRCPTTNLSGAVPPGPYSLQVTNLSLSLSLTLPLPCFVSGWTASTSINTLQEKFWK